MHRGQQALKAFDKHLEEWDGSTKSKEWPSVVTSPSHPPVLLSREGSHCPESIFDEEPGNWADLLSTAKKGAGLSQSFTLLIPHWRWSTTY